MKKTYRCFVDLKAEDNDEAIEKLDEKVLDAIREESTVGNIVRVQEDPFDDEEEATVLEIARMALSDAEIFDRFASKFTYTAIEKLQDKIYNVTERA